LLFLQRSQLFLLPFTLNAATLLVVEQFGRLFLLVSLLGCLNQGDVRTALFLLNLTIMAFSASVTFSPS
jgi:hypothetical protein